MGVRELRAGHGKYAGPSSGKRYLPVEGVKLFSTGNNPVETLVPIMHLTRAGYAEKAAVFIPGGHGAMIGLPTDEQVCKVLRRALENNRHIVTPCHGAAALEAHGITLANDAMTGTVHADRKLLTGDGPLAADALVKMAVEHLSSRA